MPSIKLTDRLGLDASAQLVPTSALLKYFQQLPSLRLDSLDLSKVGGLTIDEPAIHGLNTGVTFENPVTLGEKRPTLTVGAGGHASLQLIHDVADLPGQDPSLDITPGSCYVSFGLNASVSAGVSIAPGSAEFGVSPSTQLELTCYSRFPLKRGILLVEAVQQAVAGFRIPLSSVDLAEMPAGQIARAAVTGKLSLSGSAELFATANPLASAKLPSPLPAATVTAGGSATVGIACEIEAEYEIVARKLDSGAVRLGWYRRRTSEVSVSARVSEGLSLGLGGEDLFSRLVGAISANPKADLQELAAAGVPESQAKSIQSAVKSAAARKLEVAVAAAFTASHSRSASFLFEIDSSALTGESQRLVDNALHGDLSGLHDSAIPGITCIRSVWDTVRKHELELDINLLGIVNYRSIASLTLQGEVLFEPVTGALTITDSATAERIRSTQVNFGADTQKLRRVLAESFLITAAYRGAGQVVGEPSLRSTHSFFELDNATNRREAVRKLRTGLALGLLSETEAEAPAGIEQFGRTLFSVSTEYDEALMQAMFLDESGHPRPRERYEAAGRKAIQYLVQAGDVDDVRLRPATDDALWHRMKDTGQAALRGLFPGVSAPLVGAIAADYSTIVWWATAMNAMAVQISKIRQWLAQHPDAPADDREFQKLRQKLADRLRDVAAHTREEFGQPWGLIAMSLLAGRTAGAKLQIAGPILVRTVRRTLSAAGGT